MLQDKLEQALQVLGEIVNTNKKYDANRLLAEIAIHKIKEFMAVNKSGVGRIEVADGK